MSRFIDKLKLASQATAQPMGFGRGQLASAKPKILLVASLAQARVSNLADLVSGADAGLIDISELKNDGEALRGCADAVPDIPWGGWIKGSRWPRSQKIKALSGDFVIFPAASTPLGVLEDTEAGKILEVEATLGASVIRTISELPVDGVLVSGERKDGASLTWRELMLIQRFASLLACPLLVSVPSKVTVGEVKMLWEAGVDGVIVPAGAGGPRGGLRQLREAIDKLAFPSQRRRGKAKALLPPISREVEIESEEELPSDS